MDIFSLKFAMQSIYVYQPRIVRFDMLNCLKLQSTRIFIVIFRALGIFESALACGIFRLYLLFDQVVRKWLAVVKPLNTRSFFNSKLVGGLQTKRRCLWAGRKSMLILIFFFLEMRNWKYSSNRMYDHCFSFVLVRGKF